MSDFAYPLHEECGVFGIYDRAGTEDVAAAAYSICTGWRRLYDGRYFIRMFLSCRNSWT